MKNLTDWFIRNPVAANLLMMLMLVVGGVSLWGMRIEGFPKIDPNSLNVQIALEGASAEQVDLSLTQPVEQALQGLNGVKKITSLSAEGLMTVKVQKLIDYDLNRLVNDVKARVDAIGHLPKKAEKAVVTREDMTFPSLIVQVHGTTDTDTLQRIGKRAKDALLNDPLISKVQLWGMQQREISIEVNPQALQANHLSIQDIATKIEQSSLNFRGGHLRTSGGKIELRADSKAYRKQEFEQIPIKSRLDGSQLLLGQIASVRDGFVESDTLVRFQGNPSVGMAIITNNKGNMLEISRAAHTIVEQLQQQLPENVRIDIWSDMSGYIESRLDLLQNNAMQGLLLVFILLALFLNLRLAFWVAVGIPVAIAGALAVMGPLGLNYSLNDMTTFGFIIVLGILVDDAVVVAESVYSEQQKIPPARAGLLAPAMVAAEKGTHRVSVATVFGVLTTIAAFYPITLIKNEIGQLFSSFAVVVIIALLFSLVESKLILPGHLAHSLGKPEKQPGTVAQYWKRIQAFMDNGLQSFNRQIYIPLVKQAIQHRYATLMLFIAGFILSIGLVLHERVHIIFFPEVPANYITVTMEMKKGSPASLTRSNAHRIEAAASQLTQELLAEGETESPFAKLMNAVDDAHSVEVIAELLASKDRQISTIELTNRWRELTGPLEGIERLSFSATDSTGGGFEVMLTADSEQSLSAGAEAITKALTNLPGVTDIRDDLKGGQPQLQISLKPQARQFGLTVSAIAEQIGYGFGGYEVQRMQRDGNDVKVMLRYPRANRRSLHDLLNQQIRTPDNHWLPLGQVATVQSSYVPMELRRQNGKRTVIVYATLDKKIQSAMNVYKQLEQSVLPDIRKNYPGFAIAPAGELEEELDVRSQGSGLFAVILLLIYMLLAIPLKSYWQPLVIMAIIPLGLAGAVCGHLIAGIPLSILSFFGMMALTGVIVNDSLVLLTGFNRLRQQGMTIDRALVAAGSSRLRAIFLTTITTVAGLLPLLSETSEQAQYLIPAAVSLVYGLAFATGITLFLIPAIQKIGFDLSALLRESSRHSSREVQGYEQPST